MHLEPREISLRLGLLLGLVSIFVEAADDKSSSCVFSTYEDKSVLEDAKRKLAPLLGHSYVTYDQDRSFRYSIGICSTLTDAEDKTTAILQEGMTEDGQVNPAEHHNLGSLNNVHVIDGTDWVLLEYRDGESYNTHCGKEGKRSMVMITCDASVTDSNAEMTFVKEENSKTNSCFYLFEMKHSAVCPEAAGAGGLSIGSILVIVFFSLIAVYLIVGFLYQRFVLGSKGMEQFPNYEFWKDFGNLQADGCDFICRSKGRRNTDNFRGIGDEQLEPAESVRDDNLLPM